MLTPRSILRRCARRGSVFMGGPVGAIVRDAFRQTHAVARCETFLAQQGGTSTVRQLLRSCRGESVDVTISELARAVKTGAMNSQNDGTVTSR